MIDKDVVSTGVMGQNVKYFLCGSSWTPNVIEAEHGEAINQKGAVSTVFISNYFYFSHRKTLTQRKVPHEMIFSFFDKCENFSGYSEQFIQRLESNIVPFDPWL